MNWGVGIGILDWGLVIGEVAAVGEAMGRVVFLVADLRRLAQILGAVIGNHRGTKAQSFFCLAADLRGFTQMTK